VATLSIPDQTLARLQAAAAARRVSLETYLAEVAAAESGPTIFVSSSGQPTQRAAAADSIRQLAAEITHKATIDELIVDKHSGHKY
jgi:hypothetical protein